jgi:DNA-binding protein HU-beta
MNKQQLCAQVSRKTKMPKSRVMAVIDTAFESIEKALAKGQSVRMVGFGTWQKQRRKARPRRNPQTGKTLTIRARNVAKFSMGQHLHDMLN